MMAAIPPEQLEAIAARLGIHFRADVVAGDVDGALLAKVPLSFARARSASS